MTAAKFNWPSNRSTPTLSAVGFENYLQDVQRNGPDAALRNLIGGAVGGSVGGVIDRSKLAFPEIHDDGSDNSQRVFAKNGKHAILSDDALCEWMRLALTVRPESAAALARNSYAKRTLSSTGSQGGFLIPSQLIPELVVDAPKGSTLFKHVRKIPVTTSSGHMPRAATNAVVSWGQENVAIGTGDPSFGKTDFTINRMNVFCEISKEAANDSTPELVEAVGRMFQDAMLLERDRVIAIGSGSGRPLGIYSASGITDVNVTSLTYANLVDLKNAIDQRYWSEPSFVWHFNQNVLGAIMKLVDSTGQPLVRESAIRSEPPTILGVPYVVENSFPDCFIGIGALRYYVWFHREGPLLEVSDQGDAFKQYQVWMRVVERIDGRPVLPPTVPLARSRILSGVS